MRHLVAMLMCLAWLGWTASGMAGEAKPPEAKPPQAIQPAQADCEPQVACAVCGCPRPCKKVCRVVCETKKVEETVWEVECEEFCPLLPKIFGRKGACAGADCGPELSDCGVCAAGGGKELCPPQCGKPRCKKTLVKKTVTKEVPVYRCVVEHVCGVCCGAEPAGQPTPPAGPAQKAAPAPPPPPPKAPAKAAFRPAIQPAAAIPEAPEQQEEPLPRLVLGG
ncbi:MAG: hypothetical protein NZ602_02060 [Thermoguttaceae bacterium]|nr:hypothetical protein [Thermoguttaceae bacterium]MDW8039782.1 hypothetical protein [Thermoguttaceae bacterium]